MFYSVYLFSSLILICNNFARSNENVQKVTWTCASKDCDTPISEFSTSSNLKYTDHADKLRYTIGSKGQVFKKPSDNSPFWFAEINGNYGYINKNAVRENKVFHKDLNFMIEEDYPFQRRSSQEGSDKIAPSQPTVVAGTTFYDNDLDESDVNKVLPSANSDADSKTPPLSPTQIPDTTGTGTGQTGSPQSGDAPTGPELKVEGGSSESNKNDDSGNVGLGSSTPVDDFYDDEEEGEEIKAEEDEVPLNLPSTNQREQSESIKVTDDGSKETSQVDNDRKLESSGADSSPQQDPMNGPFPQGVPFGTQDTEFSTESSTSQSVEESSPTTEQSGNSYSEGEKPITEHLSTPHSVEEISTEAPMTEPSNTHTENPITVDFNPSPNSEEISTEVPTTEQPSTSDGNEENLNTGNLNSSQSNEETSTPIPTVEQHIKEEASVEETSSTPQEVEQTSTENPTIDEVNALQDINETIADVPESPEGIEKVEVPSNGSGAYNVPPNSFSYLNYMNQPMASPSPGVADPSVNNYNNDYGDSPPPIVDTHSSTVGSTDDITSEMPNLYQNDVTETPPSDQPSSIESAETLEENVQTTQIPPLEATIPTPERAINVPEEPPKDEPVTSTQPPFDTDQLQTEATPGFYSSVSSFFSSLTELFDKSQLPVEDSSPQPQPDDATTTENPPATAPPGHCYDGISCGGLEPPIGGEDQHKSPWDHYSNVDLFKSSVPLSYNSIMYICITSVVVLLFSLGYYYIDKSQNSSSLVAKVNQLSQELFVTKKERDTLEDQLLKIKENCNIMDSSKIKQDSKLSSLQNALEKSEGARAQLEETVIRLEKEVETLMDQGLEMHKLLSDTISDEDRSQMLLANIDELKESLSEKLNEIVLLTNQLDKKNEEIQLCQIDVRNANDRISDLERKLESCKSETEEAFTSKLQEHQKQNLKLQKLMEEKGVSIAKLESELAKTKADRDSAEARASSAEAGLQAAHGVGTGEARQTWLDATAARAALATSNKQNEDLRLSIQELNTSNKLLQDKVSSLNEELSELNLKYENVEREKVNALTKLQVLSDYFKEKETKLQEELGVKESQWLQKESEDHSIYEQMKSLREEISSYKAQNEKLRGEILEQEASYKVQIANEEQKTYDNWVALRQAERKVKELQMESAHFRNRLTQLETANNQSTAEVLNPNGLDKSSFGAPSPPFMMLPPPPVGEFFPLPPPPIHPTASRPPPLGRISSPQLTGEMIPPPPLVPFDMYPPPSSTPPPPIPLYKPQPRDRPPPPKDSPPSNYSSESVNDKPPRRRRR